VGLQEELTGASEYQSNFYEEPFGWTSVEYQKDITQTLGGVETGKQISDFSWTAGYLKPVISVGMSLPVASWELKPRLGLAFGFDFSDGNGNSSPALGIGTGSFVYENYRSVNGVDASRTKVEYTADRLVYRPALSLGADLDFAPGIGPSLVVDGSFGFRGKDNGVTTKQTVINSAIQTTVTENRSNAFDEWRDLQIGIRPAYRHTLGLGDKVTLNLRGALDVDFRNELRKEGNTWVETQIYTFPNPAQSYTRTERNTNGEKQEEATTFSVTPTAVAAIQFAAIPNRLTLNAGVQASLPSFQSVSTKRTPLDEKTVTEIELADGTRQEYVEEYRFDGVDTTVTTSAWNNFDWAFAAGFSFFFNQTFGADVMFGGNSGFGLDVSNLRVLFTVKR
jgi:hypothetical protein